MGFRPLDPRDAARGGYAGRAADARARERRRAEIYALNHIMRDYFRGLGAVD